MFKRQLRRALVPAALALSVLAPAQMPYSVKWDDFAGGFSSSKWFPFNAGPFIGSDGIVTTSNQGLYVRAPGTNPITGLPMFTLTVGQENDPVDNPYGLPGGFDHVKWLYYALNFSSAGSPGFDAVPGQTLTFEAQGENFSCHDWQGNSRGRLVLSAPRSRPEDRR